MTDFFNRGPYNEIIPPNLAEGITPDEAITMLADAVREKTGKEMTQPRRGRSGEGLLRLSASFAHSQNLARALEGNLPTPDGMALRVFVDQIGEPLSLLPLFLEDVRLKTFVPIFQREDEEGGEGWVWRVGVKGKGRTQLLRGRCAEAFRKAQSLYTQWAQEEEERLTDWLKDQVSGEPLNMHTLSWWLQLDKHKKIGLKDGFTLEQWGAHSTYALRTPDGLYLLHASSGRLAARYAHVIVRRHLNEPPTPDEVMGAIKQWVPSPSRAEKLGVWQLGNAQVALMPKGRLSMKHGENRYDISVGGHIASMMKNGRQFRKLAFPTTQHWMTPEVRTRILLGWCGVVTVTGG